MTAPEFPAGPYVPQVELTAAQRSELLAELATVPRSLPVLTAGMSAEMLNTRYRNWTVRQIAHHIVDSHLHAYLRTKWALAEDQPTIKPYDEGRWVNFPDATGDLQPSLLMLNGLHTRWAALLHSLSPSEWQRSYFHPEGNRTVSIDEVLGYYVRHSRHHPAQIQWIRDHAARS